MLISLFGLVNVASQIEISSVCEWLPCSVCAKADYCTRLVKRTKVPFIISDKVGHPCEMVINAGRSGF
jgi:hypothetical protein